LCQAPDHMVPPSAAGGRASRLGPRRCHRQAASADRAAAAMLSRRTRCAIALQRRDQGGTAMSLSILRLLVGLVIAFASLPDARAKEGAPAHGEAVSRKCQACHSIEEGVNRVGPSLHGVMGRQAGTLPGYGFSRVLTDSDIIWTDLTLNAWLASP